MQDKVALVTGAGSGIGRAIAVRLAREGAAVVVADIDEHGGAETVRQIEADGGRAAFVLADVAVEADVRAMVTFTEQHFEGLDISLTTPAAPLSHISRRQSLSTGVAHSTSTYAASCWASSSASRPCASAEAV